MGLDIHYMNNFWVFFTHLSLDKMAVIFQMALSNFKYIFVNRKSQIIFNIISDIEHSS